MDIRLNPFVRREVADGWRLDRTGDITAWLSRRRWWKLRRDQKVIYLHQNNTVEIVGPGTSVWVDATPLVRARVFDSMDEYVAQLPH